MTDHANELRRNSRKIGHPAGDVPSVMLAAAEEIERLAERLEAAEKDIAVKEEVIDSLAAVVKRLDAQCDAAERERDECNRRRLEAADHFAAQTELMKKKCGELRAKIAETGKQEPHAEWFSWLPEGTTHISKIRTVSIPCFGFEARFNAFKYIDGVLFTYRTDSDNEYGEWVKAAPRYKDGVLPVVYQLYALPGAKGE